MKTTNIHTAEIEEIKHSLELTDMAVKSRIIKPEEARTLRLKIMADAGLIRKAMLNERRAS